MLCLSPSTALPLHSPRFTVWDGLQFGLPGCPPCSLSVLVPNGETERQSGALGTRAGPTFTPDHSISSVGTRTAHLCLPLTQCPVPSWFPRAVLLSPCEGVPVMSPCSGTAVALVPFHHSGCVPGPCARDVCQDRAELEWPQQPAEVSAGSAQGEAVTNNHQ